jgi:putative (di)nucleoside polyphosphate hydrolase
VTKAKSRKTKLKNKTKKKAKKAKKKQAKLPYRPCAGIALFNKHGHVFIGRRNSGPEHMDPLHVWQMPQGGIDEGEDHYDAALRELYEETNVRSVQKLGVIAGWLTYDLPPHLVGKAWKGKYRGQKQKWFALRFTGEDGEIDIHHPGGGKYKPEFVDWRWEPIGNLTTVVVPFKREAYRQIVKAFRKYAKAE